MRGLGALPPGAAARNRRRLNTLRTRSRPRSPKPASGSAAPRSTDRLAGERADVTLPVPTGETGRIHPISQTIDEIVAIFGEMGFAVAEGPHIEEDFYNFTALNIPPEHPARQEHDTFYLPPRAGRLAAGAAHPYLAGADPHDAGADSRRSASSSRAAPSAPTTTRPTRRCSTRSKGWWSTARPIWAT